MSVIVPVYNVKLYLKECIDSICEQTLSDIEIILVDDGSTDKSGFICDEFAAKDSRIKVIHQKNAGIAAARNTGIRKALGKWLVFVDSDDYYAESTFLMHLSDTISKNQADIVTFGARRVQGNKTEQIYEGLEVINDMPIQTRIKWLVKNEKISVSAWMHAIKRKYLLENDFFFDENFKTGEDIEWMLRILAKQPAIVGNNHCAYTYRVRPNSLCTLEHKSKYWIYRYDSIIKSIEYIENSKSNIDYKRSYLSYVAYIYYILIAEISKEPIDTEKKLITKKCKELLWLRDYAVGRKSKIAKFIVDVFGITIGGSILQIRIKRHRKI